MDKCGQVRGKVTGGVGRYLVIHHNPITPTRDIPFNRNNDLILVFMYIVDSFVMLLSLALV